MKDKEKEIVKSWHKNAAAWVRAIQNSEIESRNLVTNQAIIKTLLSLPIKNAIDLGCGEGWLSNELQSTGIDILGVDVVPELIGQAANNGHADFKATSYEAFSRQLLEDKFDAAICNFSLFGKAPVEELLNNLHNLIKDAGFLVIQTLHPKQLQTIASSDGWQKGSWSGFNERFTNPPPWYYRTLDSWLSLLKSNNLELLNTYEPRHPATGKTASIIFVARLQS